MFIRKKMKLGIVAGLVLCVTNFMATSAFAASQALVANISLQTAVAFTNATSVNFGTIQPPTFGSNTISVDRTGNRTISGGGGNAALTGGTVNAGSISLSGGVPGGSINLSVVIGGCPGSGGFLILSAISQDASVSVFGDGSTSPVPHGGTVQVFSELADGAYTCDYTINANN